MNSISNAKMWTLQHMRELVETNVEKVGPVMDDYEGGQVAAYERVLNDIKLFETIIGHTSDLERKE
jgi:hypothetical protein